jgi:hypothetical protein
MRWRFPDPTDADGTRSRSEVTGAIARFWEKAVPTLRSGDPAAAERLATELGSIDPALALEVDPTAHTLLLQPGSIRSLHPIVADLVAAAPPIEGWTVHRFRPPADLGAALARVAAKSAAPVDLHSVAASLTDAHRIDIAYVTPLATDFDEATLQSWLVTETLLGEEALDSWIGKVETTLPPRGWWSRLFPRPDTGVPPAELPGLVDALRRNVLERLPAAPWHQLTPRPARIPVVGSTTPPSGDPPQRTDVVAGETLHPPLFQASRDSLGFASARYSRHGETFAYVKLEATAVALPAAKRNALEERIHQALTRADVGGALGSSSGHRYAYVDLSLVDVDRAIPIVRSVLHEAGGSHRSWILFLDDALAEEWVGIWPDTTPPP